MVPPRHVLVHTNTEAESKEKHAYAGVDYNLTLCPLQSRLQHIYHVQPYARVDLKPYTKVDFISPVEDFMNLASGQPELAAQIYQSTRE